MDCQKSNFLLISDTFLRPLHLGKKMYLKYRFHFEGIFFLIVQSKKKFEIKKIQLKNLVESIGSNELQLRAC